jgi:hypothetical protein
MNRCPPSPAADMTAKINSSSQCGLRSLIGAVQQLPHLAAGGQETPLPVGDLAGHVVAGAVRPVAHVGESVLGVEHSLPQSRQRGSPSRALLVRASASAAPRVYESRSYTSPGTGTVTSRTRCTCSRVDFSASACTLNTTSCCLTFSRSASSRQQRHEPSDGLQRCRISSCSLWLASGCNSLIDAPFQVGGISSVSAHWSAGPLQAPAGHDRVSGFDDAVSDPAVWFVPFGVVQPPPLTHASPSRARRTRRRASTYPAQ